MLLTGDFGVSTIMDDARTRTRTTVGVLVLIIHLRNFTLFVSHGAEESDLTLFPVKFTIQFLRKSIHF